MRIFILAIILTLTSCASNGKKEINKVKDKSARLYYDQGTQELADKEYTVALNHLQQAYKYEPDNTHILNNLGMAYYFKGASGTAIKYLKKAIDEDEKNTAARMNLATIYMRNKDYGKAEREFLNISKDLNYLSQFRTYFNLGVLYQAKGQNKKAMSFFKKSIKENENYCPAHYQLGHQYFKAGHYEVALKKYKDASFGTCYNNPRPHLQQAKTLTKLGRYKKARESLTKIIEKFATTKYRVLAQKELSKIDRLERSSIKSYGNQSKNDGKILTPDF